MTKMIKELDTLEKSYFFEEVARRELEVETSNISVPSYLISNITWKGHYLVRLAKRRGGLNMYFLILI